MIFKFSVVFFSVKKFTLFLNYFIFEYVCVWYETQEV